MHSHSRTVMYTMLVCVLLATTSYAADIPFSSDVEAINKAAQSVLMLEVYDADDELIGTGSGFVAFDNYTLVTNEHVIKDAAIIIGNSDDGDQYMVTKVIVADAKMDIAILEFFSPTDLSPLSLNERGEIQRAEQVVAIGSPLGLKNSVSLGNISALFEDNEVSLIQFTAPISPGSSGGALFDDKGQVIGITSGFFTEGQNINLAINIDEVIDLYGTSHTNERSKLSNYSKYSPTPNVTATANPAATPFPLEGYLNFVPSAAFNYSVLKDYQGYKYDKFDKWWSYSQDIYLDKGILFKIRLSGDDYIENPPDILILSTSETSSGAFVKSIDFLISDKIYTYQNLRYYNDIKGLVFFYLGSVGKQMVTEMTETTTMLLRLTMHDSEQMTYEIKLHEYTPVFFWCKNIIKHKIFELFQPRMLTYADKVHNATVH